MRLNNKIFGGASRYFWDNEALQPVAGSENWFGEFQPVNHRGLAFISALLEFFFGVRICCHINGEFPTYIAGYQTSFNSASILFALKDHPILRLIFQIEADSPAVFNLGTICFTLLRDVENTDVSVPHQPGGTNPCLCRVSALTRGIPPNTAMSTLSISCGRTPACLVLGCMPWPSSQTVALDTETFWQVPVEYCVSEITELPVKCG
jgi:hypothetical protein